MHNYIKAELYRSINRTYLWVYTGILATLALAAVVICKVNNVPDMDVTSLTKLSTYMLSMPVFLVIPMLDIVTAEEQKNQTMRNVITFGISRNKIILSKLIVTVVLAVIAAFIILIVFYGSSSILLGLGKGFPEEFLANFQRILIAVPLWIAAIFVGTFLAIFISNSTMFGVVYFVVFLFTKNIIQLLEILISDKFSYVHKFLITTQLSKLSNATLTGTDKLTIVMIATAYIAAFTILSMLYFNKKEIK